MAAVPIARDGQREMRFQIHRMTILFAWNRPTCCRSIDPHAIPKPARQGTHCIPILMSDTQSWEYPIGNRFWESVIQQELERASKARFQDLGV